MRYQGGGVTSHYGVEIYIDLIVSDLTSIQADYPQTAELFAAFAKYRQGKSNFGYAEIDKDHRLRESLSASKAGIKLYEKLRKNAPIITVSSQILGNGANAKNVKIFPLSELEKDPLAVLDKIQKAARVQTKSDTRAFLNGIDRLNKILSIKPGFFGISINVNAFVDEWIKKRRP